jgi:hypothetical protein
VFSENLRKPCHECKVAQTTATNRLPFVPRSRKREKGLLDLPLLLTGVTFFAPDDDTTKANHLQGWGAKPRALQGSLVTESRRPWYHQGRHSRGTRVQPQSWTDDPGGSNASSHAGVTLSFLRGAPAGIPLLADGIWMTPGGQELSDVHQQQQPTNKLRADASNHWTVHRAWQDSDKCLRPPYPPHTATSITCGLCGTRRLLLPPGSRFFGWRGLGNSTPAT